MFDPQGVLAARHPQVTQHALISSAVVDCNLILLCLPDRLALQRKIIQHIQTLCLPDTILSVMSKNSNAEDLQGCAKWPGSIVHINLSDKGIVTLNTTALNTPETEARISDLIASLGLETVLVQDAKVLVQ